MQTEANTRVRKPIFTDGFLEDPYPSYRRLQDAGPVHFVDMGPGFHAVFSYATASALLKDVRFSAKRSKALILTIPEEHRARYTPLMDSLSLWLLFLDPPQHSRLRRLLNKGFSPAAAEQLRPRIEALVDSMLDELSGKSEAELMSDFAHAFPARVISELLAFPPALQTDLVRWSDAIAAFIGIPNRTPALCDAAQEAVLALSNVFREALAERRKSPGSDLISLLMDIEADGDGFTEDELYAQCVMLLFAGHETTRNLIGNGIHSLLRYPGELEKLRDNPLLIRSGVEEFLRFQSPVQYTARLATEEVEIEGVRLHPGEPVQMMLGAINRDPKQFENPDVLDIGRSNNSHLAFGAGPHFCIGNQIARLEAQTAILKLVQRFPKLRFAQQPVEWMPSYALRGFRSLPVCID